MRWRVLVSIFLLVGLASACTHRRGHTEEVAIAPSSGADVSARVRVMLDQAGPQLDHGQLMAVYMDLSAAAAPVDHMHRLLADLMAKRNDHPRIDQMILIFTAKIIGESRFAIPQVEGLFDAILDQTDRLNEWVIAFVADAIGRYPYDLAQGDRLVDRMDSVFAQIRENADPSQEHYGFHFLPPPRRTEIKSYLAGISQQQRRESERQLYYSLILKKVAEDDVAASLVYLQARERDGLGPPCPQKMLCLLRMIDRLPLP